MSIEIIVALITSIIAPTLTIWLTHKIRKVQDKADTVAAAAKEEPDIQTKLRDELRGEVERQMKKVRDAEKDNDALTEERDELLGQVSKWKKVFYSALDEKASLGYELSQARRELEELKVQLLLLQSAKEQIDGIVGED